MIERRVRSDEGVAPAAAALDVFVVRFGVLDDIVVVYWRGSICNVKLAAEPDAQSN